MQIAEYNEAKEKLVLKYRELKGQQSKVKSDYKIPKRKPLALAMGMNFGSYV